MDPELSIMASVIEELEYEGISVANDTIANAWDGLRTADDFSEALRTSIGFLRAKSYM